ncbi:hypothetical protein AKJ09_07898 [Labilithrix luteola]|uniref:Uncharacterized protein n=1 Tax=Labilithrix luteola TaxID=1391654 RepID=A0A0K1Q771_9BACT|nr:hypothetical protein [Labilithrix luteola]AKV01235.1 hypothetical protein AKJ09_07898 [Labilithrix luteola]
MKLARLTLVRVLPLVAAAALLPISARSAHACGMSVGLEEVAKPTPVQEIARAEKSLENGQNVAAARTVLATFAAIRNTQAGGNPLETRAMRVFAMAVVRTAGNIREVKKREALDWTPAANVEWAIQALREIDAKRPNDPTVQADLGEALSAVTHGQAEALEILGKLADKDLMGSPFAYAALARLRSQKGDAAGAEAASKRCVEMTKTPGVCKPAAPKGTTTTVAAKV